MSDMVVRSHRVKTVKGTVETGDESSTSKKTEIVGTVPPTAPPQIICEMPTCCECHM